jgi:Protein of unknown function (DUF2975)
MNNVCDKTSRKARWLRYALIATMAVVILANVLLAWRGAGHHVTRWGSLQIDVPTDLASYPTLALIYSVLLSLIFLYGLYRLVLLMRLFERGEFFSTPATRHLRAFAFTLLLGTALGCVLPAIELIAARLIGLNHVTAVSIDMDGSDAWMILISTLFFVIAWIMGEARQLAEDNQLIV